MSINMMHALAVIKDCTYSLTVQVLGREVKGAIAGITEYQEEHANS